MWKFKAFCLDYWHVLCLHPHNNFYKRYVCVFTLRVAVLCHTLPSRFPVLANL